MRSVPILNYQEFYDYYSNFITGQKLQTTVSYFPMGYVRDQQRIDAKLSADIINIDNTIFHISKLGDGLKFTYPVTINNLLWDFHYHFGLEPNRFKHRITKQPAPMIYLHKTTQDPNKPGKEHFRCHIEDNVPLDDIDMLICHEKVQGTLASQFKDRELELIKLILLKPQYSQYIQVGCSSLTKLVLGRRRKITKMGRKSMITYKGKHMSMTEARALEKKLKAKSKK